MTIGYNYIKALAVTNTANLVYAQQCFHEFGMPEGLCLVRMYDEVECVPDRGWIVWNASIGPFYEIMTDEEFRNTFTPYDDLPQKMKEICDSHPSYDEWVQQINEAEERASQKE